MSKQQLFPLYHTVQPLWHMQFASCTMSPTVTRASLREFKLQSNKHQYRDLDDNNNLSPRLILTPSYPQRLIWLQAQQSCMF